MAESRLVKEVVARGPLSAVPRLGKLHSLFLCYQGSWLDYFPVALGTQTMCHSDLHLGRLGTQIPG